MIAQKRQPDRVLPLVLIVLGAFLLVFNAGLLGFGRLLDLLQLWPLALIAVGIDLLFKGRYRLAVVLATLIIGTLFYTNTLAIPGMQPAQTQAISQPLEGAARAEVHLSPSVGELRIGALSGSENLIEGTVRTARGERVVESFQASGGAAVFELKSEGRMGGSFNIGREHGWDLRLNPNVPLALDIDTGVGRSELDLADLQITNLSIDTGVGETLVTLPRTGRYEASLSAGVGATTVRVPGGMAARVQVSSGLGAVTVRGGLERDGEIYLSPGYASAEHRVDLRVSGGVGAITIEAGF
jgi:hypothetical protein